MPKLFSSASATKSSPAPPSMTRVQGPQSRGTRTRVKPLLRSNAGLACRCSRVCPFTSSARVGDRDGHRVLPFCVVLLGAACLLLICRACRGRPPPGAVSGTRRRNGACCSGRISCPRLAGSVAQTAHCVRSSCLWSNRSGAALEPELSAQADQAGIPSALLPLASGRGGRLLSVIVGADRSAGGSPRRPTRAYPVFSFSWRPPPWLFAAQTRRGQPAGQLYAKKRVARSHCGHCSALACVASAPILNEPSRGARPPRQRCDARPLVKREIGATPARRVHQ